MLESLSALISSLGQEAIKTWGSLAIVVALLGFAIWVLDRRSRAKDERIKELEAEIGHLQEQRVQDAQRMIQVTESGTATMRSRLATDERMTLFMEAIGALMESGRLHLPPPESR